MPVNVLCRFTDQPANTHIWCRMQYSAYMHHVIKEEGVSKVLDYLLNGSRCHLVFKDIKRWHVRGAIAVIQQFYPYASYDPRIPEIAKKHNLQIFDWNDHEALIKSEIRRRKRAAK